MKENAYMENREYQLLTIGRQFYLREKYAALNVESVKKIQNGEIPIKNQFRYFLRMLEDDAFQPAAY